MKQVNIGHFDQPDLVQAILQQEIRNMEEGYEGKWSFKVLSNFVRVSCPHELDAIELLKRWGKRLSDEDTATALLEGSTSHRIWVRCTHLDKARMKIGASLALLRHSPSAGLINLLAQDEIAQRLAREAKNAGVSFVTYSYGYDPDEWEFCVDFHGLLDDECSIDEILGHYWDFTSAPSGSDNPEEPSETAVVVTRGTD